MIDIDFFVIVLNWLLAALFAIVVLKNIRNVTDKITAKFWLAQCAFAGLRGLNALLFSQEIIELDTFKILSTIITFLIFGYLMWYFVKKYGDKAVDRIRLENTQLDYINSLLPFNLSKIAENIVGEKGYHFDINLLLDGVTKSWQPLGDSGILYRLYQGEKTHECKVAIETETIKDVTFPWQWHSLHELIFVLKGEMGIKPNVTIKPGESYMILENDPHYFIAKKGTRSVHYFIQP